MFQHQTLAFSTWATLQNLTSGPRFPTSVLSFYSMYSKGGICWWRSWKSEGLQVKEQLLSPPSPYGGKGLGPLRFPSEGPDSVQVLLVHWSSCKTKVGLTMDWSGEHPVSFLKLNTEVLTSSFQTSPLNSGYMGQISRAMTFPKWKITLFLAVGLGFKQI
jgi:hypothetical protein